MQAETISTIVPKPCFEALDVANVGEACVVVCVFVVLEAVVVISGVVGVVEAVVVVISGFVGVVFA